MNKEDIKEEMSVIFKNNIIGTVIKNEAQEDKYGIEVIVDKNNVMFLPLSDFSRDLTYKHNAEYDIVRVYEFNNEIVARLHPDEL